MMQSKIDEIHQQILSIKNHLNKLAHDVTDADNAEIQCLDPDFTLIEIAKILSCLLNNLVC